MTKQDPWFMEERAFAFASLVLTKRKEAVVRREPERNIAMDLLVEVLRHGQSTLRFFGVQMIASMELPTVREREERVRSYLGSDWFEPGIPLCVFAIGVRKPEGIYRWVVAPVVDDGQAQLHHEGEATWQTLDEAGAARLIDQVNAWYDALHGGPASKSGGRHSKTKSG